MFVGSLSRAFHFRLTTEGACFLVACMMVGSIITACTIGIMISIWRNETPPSS
jgi:type III secretory pathway component EscS